MIAVLWLDEAGHVVRRGGAWAQLAPALSLGRSAAELLPMLHARPPAPCRWPRVALPSGAVADVHLLDADAGELVVLVGAAAEVAAVTAVQQAHHERLLARRDEVWAPLGLVVLHVERERAASPAERAGAHTPDEAGALRLRAAGDLPLWLAAQWPSDDGVLRADDAPPFLAHVLAEAEAAWRLAVAGPTFAARSEASGTAAGPVPEPGLGASVVFRSGPWSAGEGGALEARALVLEDGAPVLVIERLGEAHGERVHTLQRARELALRHGELLSDVERREMMLHCIVHDLGSPLGAVISSLDAAARAPEELQRTLHDIALRQARQASALLEALTAVSSVSLGERAEGERTAVVALARAVVDELGGARQRRVRLEARADGWVALDRLTLRRVLVNLVENALRHAPADDEVVVEVGVDPAGVQLAVLDRGPGVPPALAPRLFAGVLGADPHRSGKLGLGLHYCRLAVERAGGQVMYTPREGGGARFVVSLPLTDGRPALTP